MSDTEDSPIHGLRALRTPLDFIILFSAIFGIYEILKAANFPTIASLIVAAGVVAALVAADYYFARRGVAPYFRLFGFARVPRSAVVLGSSIELEVPPSPAKPEFTVARDYVFLSSPSEDDCFDTLEDSIATAGQSLRYSSPDAHIVRQTRSAPGRVTVYWAPNTPVHPCSSYSHTYQSSLLAPLDWNGNFYIVSHAYRAGYSKVKIKTWRPIREASCYAKREAYFSDEQVFRRALTNATGVVSPANFAYTSQEIVLSLENVTPGTRVYIVWTHDVEIGEYWEQCATQFLEEDIAFYDFRSRLERWRVRRLLAAKQSTGGHQIP